jgi:hypothetical protein
VFSKSELKLAAMSAIVTLLAVLATVLVWHMYIAR